MLPATNYTINLAANLGNLTNASMAGFDTATINLAGTNMGVNAMIATTAAPFTAAPITATNTDAISVATIDAAGINLATVSMATVNMAVFFHRAGKTRRSRPHDAGNRAPGGAGGPGGHAVVVPVSPRIGGAACT